MTEEVYTFLEINKMLTQKLILRGTSIPVVLEEFSIIVVYLIMLKNSQINPALFTHNVLF